MKMTGSVSKFVLKNHALRHPPSRYWLFSSLEGYIQPAATSTSRYETQPSVQVFTNVYICGMSSDAFRIAQDKAGASRSMFQVIINCECSSSLGLTKI